MKTTMIKLFSTETAPTTSQPVQTHHQMNLTLKVLNSTNQEPQRPMEFPTCNIAWKETIATNRLLASAHAYKMLNTSKIKIAVN